MASPSIPLFDLASFENPSDFTPFDLAPFDPFDKLRVRVSDRVLDRAMSIIECCKVYDSAMERVDWTAIVEAKMVLSCLLSQLIQQQEFGTHSIFQRTTIQNLERVLIAFLL